jgi:uncharacterized iron-regulated membrane protein
MLRSETSSQFARSHCLRLSMPLLRQLHRWVGFSLALVVAFVALSGGLLLFRTPYYRLVYPTVRTPITAAQHTVRADVLTAIETRWKDVGVQLVKFPRPDVNAYQVWLRDGTEAFVDSQTGAVIDHWRWYERPPALLFELHAHLFAERPGTIVNGMVALIVVAMTLTGVVLWWPGRRGAFRLRGAVPRGSTRPELLRSHAATGVLAAVPILVFVVTGAIMAFYQPTARVLSLLLDGRAPAEADARVAPQDQPTAPWTQLLTTLDGVFPEGDAVYYYPGTADNARLMFRKRLPGEWHPNGRSYIVVDPFSGRVVQTIDARTQGVATRFMNTIYPVHAATVGGAAMIGAGAIAAIALTWLAAGGAWTFIARLRGRRDRSKKDALPAAA